MKHTKQQKYLDAAVANADWWVKGNGSLSTNYTTYSLLTMNMADIARATRKPQYTDFIRAHAEQFFARQILRDTRPLVSGAFSGEDMAKHYRPGSSVGDFISLRSTSYGALALGRLACTSASNWNPSYSAFGW